MTSEGGGSAHRKIRRTRRSRSGDDAAPKPGPPAERAERPERAPSEPPPPPTPPSSPPPRRGRGQSREDRDAERNLRGLIGAGTSMVGPVGAMRVRDVARPTEEDLAEAEREVVIVRRNYVPPDRPIPGVRPSRRGGADQPGSGGSSPEAS